MPVKHVQQHVKNAQKSVKENKAWNSAKNFAVPVLMPATNVQMNAEL
jgi:predicted metal-dependent peptidase